MTGAGVHARRRSGVRVSQSWVPVALVLLAGVGWWWAARTAGQMAGPSGAVGMSMVAGSAMSLFAFLVAWVAMMAAMMLPAVVPVVRLYARAAARGTVAPVAVFVTGYVLVWASVGVPAFIAWRALRGPLAEQGPWVGRFAGLVAITAAVYEISPLKTVCLRHCRNPLSFFLRDAKHLNRPSGAVSAGARHGLFCLGCCWLLMAVLVAFGTMQLSLMVALAVLILLEKNAPFGERLAQVAGGAFLILGAALVLHPSFISSIV